MCLPVYNGEKFLKRSIESILEQSYGDFEFLIVDDASSDRSFEIAGSFQDSRIRLLRNENRLGLARNWNRCLELSQGEYVTIFHQDDIMLPFNVEKKRSALEENPDAGMVYSGMFQIDSEGREIKGHPFWRTCNPPSETLWPAPQGFAHFNREDNPVCCPGVMMRRGSFEKVGGFNPELPFTADWEMWLKIAVFFSVIFLAGPLFKYRWHEQNETLRFSPRRNLEQKWKAKDGVLRRYAPELAGSGELKKQNNRLFSGKFRRLAREQARENIFEAAVCLAVSAKLSLAS